MRHLFGMDKRANEKDSEKILGPSYIDLNFLCVCLGSVVVRIIKISTSLYFIDG